MDDGGRYSIQSPKVSNLFAHAVQYSSAVYTYTPAPQASVSSTLNCYTYSTALVAVNGLSPLCVEIRLIGGP